MQYASYAGISSVERRGARELFPPLEPHFSSSRVPTTKTILLQLPDRLVDIPVKDVTLLVRDDPSVSNRVILGAIGLTIDVIVVGTVVVAMSAPWHWSTARR